MKPWPFKTRLLVSFTYATSGSSAGSIGANPQKYSTKPGKINNEEVTIFYINFFDNTKKSFEDTLKDAQDQQTPVVIIIEDSMIHTLDLRNISSKVDDTFNILLNKSLYIQAEDNQRPIIKLAVPLSFRPTAVKGQTEKEQKKLDDIISNLTVHLEGLYITRDNDFQGNSLIERAALNQIEIVNCILDPGGKLNPDKTHGLIEPSVNLKKDYGFIDPIEKEVFSQIPTIVLQRSITGPLFISNDYWLALADSVLDAGSGVGIMENGDPSKIKFALAGDINNPSDSWGPPIINLIGITVFGKMRVESINGSAKGGIWVHALVVNNDQKGCIKFSYFNGDENNKLPQSFACVTGKKDSFLLRFENEIFGEPDYAQLSRSSDFEILERGPRDDAMGATGFLMESHKWRNLQIRYREFMPVGVKQLMLPVLVKGF